MLESLGFNNRFWDRNRSLSVLISNVDLDHVDHNDNLIIFAIYIFVQQWAIRSLNLYWTTSATASDLVQ